MDVSSANRIEANKAGIQRDAFIDAIKAYEVISIPLGFPPSGEESVKSTIEASGLFVVGETHGQQATPNALYTLTKQFGFTQLALEWDTTMQPLIDEDLDSGNLRSDIPIDTRDGRVTAGHFAVLMQLKKEGCIDRCHCIRPPMIAEPNDNDAGMAKNLTPHIDIQKPLLVVAGNQHTRNTPFLIEEPFFGAGSVMIPLGALLKQNVPHVGFGELQYSSDLIPSLDTPAFLPSPENKFLSDGRAEENTPIPIAVEGQEKAKKFGVIE